MPVSVEVIRAWAAATMPLPVVVAVTKALMSAASVP